MKTNLSFALIASLLLLCGPVFGKANSRPRSSSRSKYVACAKNPSLALVADSTKSVKDTADRYFGKNSYDAQAYADNWVAKHPCEFAKALAQKAKVANYIVRNYYDLSPLEVDFIVAMIAGDICLNKQPIEGAKSLYRIARSRGLNVSESKSFVRTQFRERGYRSFSCSAPYVR